MVRIRSVSSKCCTMLLHFFLTVLEVNQSIVVLKSEEGARLVSTTGRRNGYIHKSSIFFEAPNPGHSACQHAHAGVMQPAPPHLQIMRKTSMFTQADMHLHLSLSRNPIKSEHTIRSRL
ncbi:hypothetical protein EV426DRAFT_18997 [Tirmania nivea]|nr:hypothetical protein EV426DRAFT_18997 [Tirmania nivea]